MEKTPDVVNQLNNTDFTLEQRISLAIDAVRKVSKAVSADEMVREFERSTRFERRADQWFAVSRRGLADGWFRITRSGSWKEDINPWEQQGKLPLLRGGLVAELLYSDQPRIIDDLQAALQEDDPAYEYLAGYGSLQAVHQFDGGEGLNMPLFLMKGKNAFDIKKLPDEILKINILGRAVRVHRLSEELEAAHSELDRELKVVGEIQRSLLPSELPDIPGFEFGAFYEPARRAGGDYYDIFELPDDRIGILIADVSGHGTPAAVLMAVTHAIAHGFGGPPVEPGDLLEHVNRALYRGYTHSNGTFVTAFYCILDTKKKTITYAMAGHNPPRLRRTCSSVESIKEPSSLPLGIMEDEAYETGEIQLRRGDALLLYTDGIVEALSPDGEQFGEEQLDNTLGCLNDGSKIIEAINREVKNHCGCQSPMDDQTVVCVLVK